MTAAGRSLGHVPTVELHVHLEGSMSLPLVRTMSAANGTDAALPDMGWVGGEHRWTDPRQWLVMMRQVADACLCRVDDYSTMMTSYVDRFAAEGGLYAEISLSLARPRRRGHDPEQVLRAACSAAAAAAQLHGIAVGVIVGLERADAVSTLLEDVALAGRVPGVVGIDVQGAPSRPLSELDGVFAAAGDLRLGIRVHAGEHQGPASVREAVDLGARRIAHGIRAVEDPILVRRLAREGITLDLCPSSNLALGVCRSWDHFPLRALRDAGVCVTLSSDDPLYFNTSARGEYEQVSRRLGLGASDLFGITLDALGAGFAPVAMRTRLLAEARLRFGDADLLPGKQRIRGAGPADAGAIPDWRDQTRSRHERGSFPSHQSAGTATACQ